MIDGNESFEICIGNKPGINPDAGKVVKLSEEPELPLEVAADVCMAPSTLDTEPKATRRRRKRGRPRMTKTAKKAAAKAKTTKSAPLAAKKDAVVKGRELPMSVLTPALSKKVAEFNSREGTLKHRLLIALVSSGGKDLREVDLQTTLYGNITPASKSALSMVLKGVAGSIASEKLKYGLTRGRNSDGEVTIRLK